MGKRYWVSRLYCEDPVLKLSGVTGIAVELSTGIVTVTLNSDSPASQQQLEGAIEDGGFTLTKIEMP